MNIIKCNSNIKELILTEDTIIYYEDIEAEINITIDKEIKLFEYIKNSNINNAYIVNNNLVFDRFIMNSSIKTSIDLDKKGISIDYFASNINKNDNNYEININHNKEMTTSNIVNHGLNLDDNKLKFIINSKVLKDSYKCKCLQDSKIIIMKDNNCEIKPNLIIDNYDVEANHSAYIGTFKQDQIFYLETRGINKDNAIKLLSKAFVLADRNIDCEIKNKIIKIIDNL